MLYKTMMGPALALLLMTSVSFSAPAQFADFKATDFRRADSVAAAYPNHSLNDLRSLASKLTKPLPTEEEKFRAIYIWICNNIENDFKLYVENKYTREKLKDPEELKAWNKKFGARVFKTLLHEKKTVCSGYAYLVKELALHAGLSCIVIDGYGRTSQSNIRGSGAANHTWNAVQLRGSWYLCDATWSSGAVDPRLETFIQKYDDSYFLADPALFVRNHYPMDSTWMLLKSKPTLHEFLNGPLIYSSAFHYAISPQFPSTFDVSAIKEEITSFRFRKNGDKAIEKAELQINKGSSTRSFYPKVYQEKSGAYCMDHAFTSKGTHVVHILLNSSYAFTYTVEVK